MRCAGRTPGCHRGDTTGVTHVAAQMSSARHPKRGGQGTLEWGIDPVLSYCYTIPPLAKSLRRGARLLAGPVPIGRPRSPFRIGGELRLAAPEGRSENSGGGRIGTWPSDRRNQEAEPRHGRAQITSCRSLTGSVPPRPERGGTASVCHSIQAIRRTGEGGSMS